MTVMLREVWLVRHGETAANAGRIIQGQTDEPLSEEGERQASRLGEWLAQTGRARLDSVVTSPLSRARRTAELATSNLGLSLQQDARLMERSFGAWEGISADEVYALQDTIEGDPFDVEPPGGESTLGMAERTWACFDDWVTRDEVGERLLLVSHGGPIGALVCRALDMPYNALNIRRFARDNTGVTILRHRRRTPGTFLLATLNAHFHLD